MNLLARGYVTCSPCRRQPYNFRLAHQCTVDKPLANQVAMYETSGGIEVHGRFRSPID